MTPYSVLCHIPCAAARCCAVTRSTAMQRNATHSVWKTWPDFPYLKLFSISFQFAISKLRRRSSVNFSSQGQNDIDAHVYEPWTPLLCTDPKRKDALIKLLRSKWTCFLTPISLFGVARSICRQTEHTNTRINFRLMVPLNKTFQHYSSYFVQWMLKLV